MLNQTQKLELEDIARQVLESDNLDRLPWSDAWKGTYPIPPTRKEIVAEAKLLEAKVLRIIKSQSIAEEYSTQKELIRMIHLESAKSINIYAGNNNS